MSVGLITIAYWIGASALGAVVSPVNLWVSRGDLKYQIGKQEQEWRRVLVAKVNFFFEALRIVIFVSMLVAGVLVAWVQFNPDPPAASLYVRGCILLILTSLVTETLVRRWLRVRLTKRSTPSKED